MKNFVRTHSNVKYEISIPLKAVGAKLFQKEPKTILFDVANFSQLYIFTAADNSVTYLTKAKYFAYDMVINDVKITMMSYRPIYTKFKIKTESENISKYKQKIVTGPINIETFRGQELFDDKFTIIIKNDEDIIITNKEGITFDVDSAQNLVNWLIADSKTAMLLAIIAEIARVINPANVFASNTFLDIYNFRDYSIIDYVPKIYTKMRISKHNAIPCIIYKNKDFSYVIKPLGIEKVLSNSFPELAVDTVVLAEEWEPNYYSYVEINFGKHGFKLPETNSSYNRKMPAKMVIERAYFWSNTSKELSFLETGKITIDLFVFAFVYKSETAKAGLYAMIVKDSAVKKKIPYLTPEHDKIHVYGLVKLVPRESVPAEAIKKICRFSWPSYKFIQIVNEIGYPDYYQTFIELNET